MGLGFALTDEGYFGDVGGVVIGAVFGISSIIIISPMLLCNKELMEDFACFRGDVVVETMGAGEVGQQTP